MSKKNILILSAVLIALLVVFYFTFGKKILEDEDSIVPEGDTTIDVNSFSDIENESALLPPALPD